MSMTRSTAARGGILRNTEPQPHASRSRDPRIPRPTSPSVTRVMRANRAGDTTPELLLRGALRKAGVKGYRKNWPRVPGRPDIAFPAAKLAVFVHGCFWHGCPRCNLPLPKSNQFYWQKHLRENQDRDKRKIVGLEAIGWRVIVRWECEIREDVDRSATFIRKRLNQLVVAARQRPDRAAG